MLYFLLEIYCTFESKVDLEFLTRAFVRLQKLPNPNTVKIKTTILNFKQYFWKKKGSEKRAYF